MTPIVGGAVAGVAVLLLVGAGTPARTFTADGPARRMRLPTRTHTALTAADLGDPDRLVTWWLATLAVVGVSAVVAPVGRLALATVLLAPPTIVVLARHRAERRRRAQLPEALDTIATSLRSGLSLTRSAQEAARVHGKPTGPEFERLAAHATGGLAFDEAIGRWMADHDDGATRIAAGALRVAGVVGGPGAQAVDAAAASLRERDAAELEAHALATQARASTILLTAAPVAFAGLLTVLDPASARFLFATPVGWACIVAGTLLDAAGAWWMSRLIGSSR